MSTSTKTVIIALAASVALAACASNAPRVVQASSDMKEVRLTAGMATQVEMPAGERVQSIVVGNPDIVTADKADNIVNLVPKANGSGETNLIVRAVDDSGDANVYQYKLVVQPN